MTTKRTCRTYSRAFKEEAVALVTEQGYSVQAAADSLGIRSNMLYRWKAQLAAEKTGEALGVDERVELKRLRRECQQLRMETEILKKASAFFAKEKR